MEPRRRLLFEAAPHDVGKRWRQGLLGRARQLGRRVREDRAQRVGRRGAAERTTPLQHLEEHAAESEDVRAVIGILSARLLGRHVPDRADRAGTLAGPVRRSSVAIDGRRQLGQTEVEDLDPIIRS